MTNIQISVAWVENIIKWIFQRKNIHNSSISINNCNTAITSAIGLNLNDFAGLYSRININLNFYRMKIMKIRICYLSFLMNGT